MSRTLLKALVTAAGMLTWGAAFALPAFNIGGYQGPVTIHFSDYENIDTPNAAGSGPSGTACQPLAVGCYNYGVLSVDQILAPIGAGGSLQPIWNSGQDGAYISGVFNNLVIGAITGTSPNVNAYSTSLVNIDLYLNPSSLNPSLGSGGYLGGLGSLTYNTVSNVAGGGLFLSLIATPGATILNPADTVASTFNLSTYPPSGTATEFLNVTGGAFASTFDTNGQLTFNGTYADMFATNTFCPNGSANCGNGTGTPVGDWQLLSSDPIRTTVPEPSTIALIGLGLLGLGIGYRRRAREGSHEA